MIETTFYTHKEDGANELIGTIRYEFTDHGEEEITFDGPAREKLLMIAGRGADASFGVPVLAAPPGAQARPVTLDDLPAYWLRHVPAEFSDGYQHAEVTKDTQEDPDDLIRLLGEDPDAVFMDLDDDEYDELDGATDRAPGPPPAPGSVTDDSHSGWSPGD